MQEQKSFVISIILMTLTCLALSGQVLTAQNEGVAKVIVMKGQIKAKLPSGELIQVKKGTWLKEGTIVQSAPKSFCRLLFIDKSTMNLGADSQMVIDKFPESEAGIITLMKGQIRSKVTKDYMDMKDKDKSKLFIKTKTAAMGVRGTDFQVNYNHRNTNTSLITFSGAVAMARIDERGPAGAAFDGNRLEQIVSSREAVMVRKGELSAVTKGSIRATIPQKMNQSQIEGLKRSSPDQTQSSKQKTQPSKKFRSPLPPGMDAKKFANDTKDTVKESVGSSLGKQLKSEGSQRSPSSVNNATSAEGHHNTVTGEYAPPAGVVIDLKTVNIIEPPKDAIFDHNTQTYVIPPELGSVDPQTGEYVPPGGMILTDDGRLKTEDYISRSPASRETQIETDSGRKVNSIATNDDSSKKTDSSVANVYDNTESDRLMDETLTENEDQIDDSIEQELIENKRPKTTFEFSRVD
jgi:hypothetical protein